MAASDHLSHQFDGYNLSFADKTVDGWKEHEITAHHKGAQIGFLNWSGGVNDIQVAKEHQRKGVATAMWNWAHTLADKHPGDILHPEHSTHRTPSGEKWAKSTGKAHYFPPEEIH